ncbi:F-box/kelch-repeat protein At3g61590-like [Bidens hawaiensis]|uniref:F-box/kelch-repeat protein At3g61590-like n=1 Tax=Bidens hawaiensis TaxID=980011 RepID=UPI004049E162
MKGETSWISLFIDDFPKDNNLLDSLSDEEGKTDNLHAVSLDSILPDDLLERILAYLPIASVFRFGCVCKRWHEIVNSRRFLLTGSPVLSQKPWYFMFTSSDEPVGYAYDPVLRKWYGIDLPYMVKTSRWFVSSSSGLVCFMDNDSRTELYVCNLITKRCVRLYEPPGLRLCDYSALSISVDRKSTSYSVTVVKSKQVPDNFFQWDLSIHVYDSVTMTWTTPVTEMLTGWRGGDESVICNGVLYFLIFSTGSFQENRHGLVGYDLSGSPARDNLLARGFIAVPCSLTCGRLMNLNESLVMVGGIGKQERQDVITGIGIWVLENKNEWREVARMPHRFFQGFGELDDVFASGGTDDLIYIQSYGAPALLVFDLKKNHWKWSQKCPVTKRFPLQLFTGFCFEPRLEISP